MQRGGGRKSCIWLAITKGSGGLGLLFSAKMVDFVME